MACQLSLLALQRAVKIYLVPLASPTAARHFQPALIGLVLPYIGAKRGGRSFVDHPVSLFCALRRLMRWRTRIKGLVKRVSREPTQQWWLPHPKLTQVVVIFKCLTQGEPVRGQVHAPSGLPSFGGGENGISVWGAGADAAILVHNHYAP